MPQYQGVWNLAQQAQALTRQQWVTDPLFDQTTLLLQGDGGANGAQNNLFLDTSSNQFAITRNGNTTQGSFSPFAQASGYWGNYFDGSGDYLSVPNSADIVFGTGNFTIEAWVYITGNSPLNGASGRAADIASCITTGPTAGWELTIQGNSSITGTGVSFANRTSASLVYELNYSTPVVQNQWHHIAVVRNGTTTTIYLNGISIGSGTLGDQNISSSNPLLLGYQNATSYTHDLNGYISNFRIVKGTAVYTGNFTPSPIPLTDVPNTKLLTCQSNRFVDTNTQVTAKTITVGGGTPSVQAFSPFAPQYQYTPTVTGGSAYFDGSTTAGTQDYLTIADTTALEPGAGDFTFETWVYHTTAAGSINMYTDQTGAGLAVYRSAGGKVQVDADGSVSILTSASNVPVNAWTYIAVARAGTTIRIYINGNLDASTTNSTNIAGTSAIAYGGNPTGSNLFTGYLSSTRFTKGAGLYTTSTINVPTAPFTTTVSSGTVNALLNFTNAGILDGTMKNNLETVGNAQVSTSVVKYGSGSLAFDGTGDWLLLPNRPAWELGSNNFTVEFWVYINSYSSDFKFLVKGTSVSNYFQFHFNNSGTSGPIITYNSGGAGQVVVVQQGNNNGWNTNVWYHLAFVRNNNVVTIYKDGVNVASSTFTGAFPTIAANVSVGGSSLASTSSLNGYMDDIRVTQGIARYTRNFTPPQVALPRQ